MPEDLKDTIYADNLEPETIRAFHPDLSEDMFNWVMAARTILHSTHVFEDIFQFENIVRAVNFLDVDFTQVQGVNPKHIWYAVDLINRLHGHILLEYSHEVIEYSKFTFREDGIWAFIPPEMLDETQEPSFIRLFNRAAQLLDPAQADEIVDTPQDMQAQRMAEMILYTRAQTAKEPINI